MRAQQIQEEAKLYACKNACYIHLEKAPDGGYNIAMAGDPEMMFEACYVITRRFSESVGTEYRKLLRQFKSVNKRIKFPIGDFEISKVKNDN